MSNKLNRMNRGFEAMLTRPFKFLKKEPKYIVNWEVIFNFLNKEIEISFKIKQKE
ncbi:hypothetical protein SCRM01_085c [Synechococcus phage S-CRM01]|uniref:hypothetical protein n=1 Tax=Synechococcus phage S-CRM01 TaxID=1026955 RepID=UPI000209E391|nr:hypothetical protein SCRM01_085c [Synechococcus phage S-CRM01]AEC53031.1 hypothetical protein SCRM01_085c [Synechococcus phage S-CRM01]